MGIPTFTPGYPPDGSSLGETKATIRDNLDGEFLVFSVDHENQNSPNGFPAGVHRKSTYPNLGSNPTTIANQFALYSKAVTGGSALFSVRDGNALTVTQLTSAAFNTPKVNYNGYTYLPGGLIFQWGIVAGSSASSVPVLFAAANINFPNAAFNVTVVPIRAATSPGSDFSTAIVTNSLFTTGFTIANIGGHTMAGWFWQAIGN